MKNFNNVMNWLVVILLCVSNILIDDVPFRIFTIIGLLSRILIVELFNQPNKG